MSEPTRYDFDEYGGCYELSEGDYVLYTDYAHLKAEVERLRKAGDAMAGFDPCIGHHDCFYSLVDAWNAAKEGKPSETKSPSFIEDLGNGVEKHDLLFRVPPAKEGKQSV